MKKTGLEELEQFTMTRGEYAKELGITPNAVRMRMRTGKLSGEYRFDGNKYFFRAPLPLRGNTVNNHGQKTTLKKIYRRGNHFKANYPNEAFRKHNEAKMLVKLKYNVDQDVQDLMPEAIEIAKKKNRDRIQEVQRSVMKQQRQTSPYVTTFNESNGGYGSTYYHSANAHLHSPITFRNTPRQKPKPKKRPYEI